MSPTVIAYDEIYNAIQNGVINAGENEAAGVEAMKFYESGPNLNITQHAITFRPICFLGQGRFKKLPPVCRRRCPGGQEAGAYGRQLESSEDRKKLDALKAASSRGSRSRPRADEEVSPTVDGRLRKEIGADDLHKINAM
jgi:TRAP-type C4-dicarboxylate transport system substrate-binding protein